MARKTPKGPRSKAAPDGLETLALDMQATDLRRRHLTYREIGERMGEPTSTAYDRVMRGLADLIENRREAADKLRRMELERLDEMAKAIYPRAIGMDADGKLTGRPNAALIDRMLRIQERRAKLLGLDAPTRGELTGPEGAPLFPAIEVRIIDPAPAEDQSAPS